MMILLHVPPAGGPGALLFEACFAGGDWDLELGDAGLSRVSRLGFRIQRRHPSPRRSNSSPKAHRLSPGAPVVSLFVVKMAFVWVILREIQLQVGFDWS